MATKRRDYAEYKPEVFEVGREQAMRLFHDWHLDIFKYRCEYLVVAVGTCFGDWGAAWSSPEVREFAGHDNLWAAIADVEKAHAIDMEELFSGHDDEYPGYPTAWDYEIWHLVDDDQLWCEWERKVDAFKELESFGVPYIGYLEGVSVDSLGELVTTMRNVKRHVRIIAEIERGYVSFRGSDFKLHDMNYSHLNKSGCFYDLTYLDGNTIHMHLFADKRDYSGWMLKHDDLLENCDFFSFRYLYNTDGVYAYDSGDGEQPLNDLDALSNYFGLGVGSFNAEIDDFVVFEV